MLFNIKLLEVDINIDEYLTTIEYDYQNFQLTMHCFICNIINGELHLNAHNAARSVTEDEMNSLNLVPADVLVVEKLKY